MATLGPWKPPRQQGGAGGHTEVTDLMMALAACASLPMQNFASSLEIRLGAIGSSGNYLHTIK